MQPKKKQIPCDAGAIATAVPLLAGFLLISAPVHAAPWTAHPTFSLQGAAHDNLNLEEDGGDNTYEGTVEVGTILQQVYEDHFFLVEGVVGYTAYSAADSEDQDNEDFQSLLAKTGYRTERTEWNLIGTLLRDTTRVDIYDPEDAIDPGADIDTVIEERNARRYRAVVRPSVEHSLTQRLTVEAGYDGTYRRYQGVPDEERAELLNHEAEVGAGYNLSEITTVGLQAQAAFFRPRNSGSDVNGDTRLSVNTYSLLADVEHELSELSSISVSGGVRQSEPAGSNDDFDTETGFVGRIQGGTEGQNWDATAFVERRLLPDNNGVLKETDQILMSVSRELRPRLKLGFSGRAFKTRSLNVQDGDTEGRDYASLQPSLTYHLSREWSVTGEYRFEYIDRAENAGDAYGNSVFLSIDFAPLREAQGF